MASAAAAEAWLALLRVAHIPLDPSGPGISIHGVYAYLDEHMHIGRTVSPAQWPDLWAHFVTQLRNEAPTYSWAQVSALGNVAHSVLTSVDRLAKPSGAVGRALRWKQALRQADVHSALMAFERRGEGLMTLVAPEKLTAESIAGVAAAVRKRDPAHLFLLLRHPNANVPHWALLWLAPKQNAALLLDPFAKAIDPPGKTATGRLLPKRLWVALTGHSKGSGAAAAAVAPLAWPGATPPPRIADPTESAVCVLYYVDQATASLTGTTPLSTEMPARIIGAYRWFLAGI